MEMTNGTALVIPMMATALVASRISAFFTPPLYRALAESNYFHVAALPGGLSAREARTASWRITVSAAPLPTGAGGHSRSVFPDFPDTPPDRSSQLWVYAQSDRRCDQWPPYGNLRPPAA